MPTVSAPKVSPKLPRRLEQLVALMPPQAIMNEEVYQRTRAMVDRLMATGKLTNDQALYLETLVQLIQSYESSHHAIDTAGISGLATLKHLLSENSLNASDLAWLLGVHESMGSKILKGERSLTVEPLRKLARRFRISPDAFIG